MVKRLVNMPAGTGQTLTYTIVNLQASATEPSPGVFGHFAAEWFPAMMSAVLGNAEEAAEEGIHILLLDVCLTCLTWHTLFPALHKASPSLSPQVKVAADALMDYLVSRPMHRSLPNTSLSQILGCCHTQEVFKFCVGSLVGSTTLLSPCQICWFTPGPTCLRSHANSAKMRAAVSVAQAPLCVCVCWCAGPSSLQSSASDCEQQLQPHQSIHSPLARCSTSVPACPAVPAGGYPTQALLWGT